MTLRTSLRLTLRKLHIASQAHATTSTLPKPSCPAHFISIIPRQDAIQTTQATSTCKKTSLASLTHARRVPPAPRRRPKNSRRATSPLSLPRFESPARPRPMMAAVPRAPRPADVQQDRILRRLPLLIRPFAVEMPLPKTGRRATEGFCLTVPPYLAYLG